MPTPKKRYTTWRERADAVLTALYAAAEADGRTPSLAEIREAYPFGQRAMWPYKVWIEEVRWFRRGRPKRRGDRLRKPTALAGQEPLL